MDSTLNNKKVLIHCDNKAVVHMINDMTSGCMVLIRLLMLNNLRCNRKIKALYIDTKSNLLSDALSRNQMEHFWKNAPSNIDRLPLAIPEEIWPVEKLWLS